MRAAAFAIACLAGHLSLVSLAPPAAAEPSPDELDQRRAALEARLGGQGFTIVVQPPFVVIGDESPATVKHHASGILKWSIQLLEAEYFKSRPAKLIEIWLFKNEKTYRKGAKKFFDDEPNTPYGYYSSEDNALVMNIGPGAGTLSHELVHPYIEANFPASPSWFNEGLASLYEQPREKEGHMWGTTNWRLPGLTRMIKDKSVPTVKALITTSRDGFYDAEYDSYAYARFLCQYLQDHGKLRDFYKKFHADQKKDPTGKASLAAIIGTDLASFDVVFRKWAANLRR